MKKPIRFLLNELKYFLSLWPVSIVLYSFLHASKALVPIVFLKFSSKRSFFNSLYHSSLVVQSKPVTPWCITSLKTPKLLEIVGTFTRDASTHLFSLFAELKIFAWIGTIFISTLAIISGNFL